MANPAHPIVFISHFLVRAGHHDAYRQLQHEMTKLLRAEKPRTLAFLTYLSDDGTQMTAIHVFADGESMDLHFQGSDERSKAAYEVLEPAGWEIYGTPSEPVVRTMREAATSAGVPLTHQPDHVAGFLRLGVG